MAITAEDYEIGELSRTFGYILENRAYKHLPFLLKRDLNLEITDKLKRTFLETTDGEEEINIIGKGTRNGEEIWVLGESQSQLSITHLQKFLKKAKRLENILTGNKVLVYWTHSARPSVVSFADKNNIKIYYSYEFEG